MTLKIMICSAHVVLGIFALGSVLIFYSSSREQALLPPVPSIGSVESSTVSREIMQYEEIAKTKVNDMDSLSSTQLGRANVTCGYGLTWTSLKAGKDINGTGFFSAYFDDRKGVHKHPVVVVLGYQWKSPENLELDLHCVFTFKNGSTLCSSKPVGGMHKYCLNNRDSKKGATSYMYLCQIDCEQPSCTDNEIPSSVSMSVGPKCVDESEAIPLQDCRPNHDNIMALSKRKTIVVCPSSPLHRLGRQEIIEFIEMNKALGVDLVSLYLTPSIPQKTIQYLKEQYVQDGTLEIFQWMIEDKWSPLYYFGQLLSMHDCMYRNMYRADYIIVEDLDELIIPLQHDRYIDMIESFNTSAHSYSFTNKYFALNRTKSQLLPNCGGMTLAKYFRRTNQFNCSFKLNDRSKYIIQPIQISSLDIHNVCGTRERYYVPSDVAILGHYRYYIPGQCEDRSISEQQVLLKFQSNVTQNMCL